MSDKMRPCPFCGSTNLKEPSSLSECEMMDSDTPVYCDDCGARGPETKLPTCDIDAWNNRAGLSEVTEALRDARAQISELCHARWKDDWTPEVINGRVDGLSAVIKIDKALAAIEGREAREQGAEKTS